MMANQPDYCLVDATIVDGTGAPRFSGDVEIAGDLITGIKPVGRGDGAKKILVNGKILSPGFVDIHSHADYTLLVDGSAESAIAQGVTSIVPGNCGHGIAPCPACARDAMASNIFGWRADTEINDQWETFEDYLICLRARGVAVNVFPLVAHGALRLAIAGTDPRPLTAGEMVRMQTGVREALAAGAAGLSTGLEYSPGISASFEELATAAEPLGEFDAYYATHCRNRTHAMKDAAIEAAEIAKRGNARLQMSHFVRRPYGPRGNDHAAWNALKAYEDNGMFIKSDIFPFEYGPTPLAVLLPSSARAGTRAQVAERLMDKQTEADVLSSMSGMFADAVEAGLADSMFVACDGTRSANYVGATLGKVSRDLNTSVPKAAYHLLRRAGVNFYSVAIVEQWVDPDDLRSALADDRFFVMSDGITSASSGPLHGLTCALSDWGYVPAYLGRYVRDMKLVSLESAVHRMSQAPARQIGLTDRGAVKIGQKADLVVFDYDRIDTQIQPNKLNAQPVGISDVFINGQPAMLAGAQVGRTVGEVGLKR